jgi:hypothetical protein
MPGPIIPPIVPPVHPVPDAYYTSSAGKATFSWTRNAAAISYSVSVNGRLVSKQTALTYDPGVAQMVAGVNWSIVQVGPNALHPILATKTFFTQSKFSMTPGR